MFWRLVLWCVFSGHTFANDVADKAILTCVNNQAAGMCCEKRGTIDSIPIRAQVEERMASSDP